MNNLSLAHLVTFLRTERVTDKLYYIPGMLIRDALLLQSTFRRLGHWSSRWLFQKWPFFEKVEEAKDLTTWHHTLHLSPLVTTDDDIPDDANNQLSDQLETKQHSLNIPSCWTHWVSWRTLAVGILSILSISLQTLEMFPISTGRII